MILGKLSARVNSSVDQYLSIDNFFTLHINIDRAKNRYISFTVVFFHAINREQLLCEIFVV